MNEINDHTNDTPPNWDSYAQLLRRQPGPAMPRDGISGMMPRIDAAIARHARRNRMIRLIAAPTLSVAMLVAIIMLQMGSLHDNAPEIRSASSEAVQAVKNHTKQVRRPVRRRVAPQPVQVEEPPVMADTAPVERVTPEITRDEPAGPGPGFSRPLEAQATPRP